MARLIGTLVVGIVVVASGAGTALTARSAPPPVSVVAVQPSDGVAVYVERVQRPLPGTAAASAWLLNLDVKLRNNGSTRLQLRRIELVYPGSTVPTFVQSLGAFDPAARVNPGKSQTFWPTDARMFPWPAPKAVIARFFFRGNDTPVTVGRPLTAWRSKVAGGAYLFPSAREDLSDRLVLGGR